MRRFAYFMRTKKPIIAAINGPAAGIGLIMTLYADMRFVSDKAVLTTSFAQRGLIAEHGISWLLPRLDRPGQRARPAALCAEVFADRGQGDGTCEQGLRRPTRSWTTLWPTRGFLQKQCRRVRWP